MNPFDISPIAETPDSVTLEWQRLAASAHVDLPGVHLETSVAVTDHILDGGRTIALNVRALVLGERLPPHTETAATSVTLDAPASPWQHWKWRHAGARWARWFVRRRPPRMVSVSTPVTLTTRWEQMAVYPWQRLARAGDGVGRPVRIVQGPESTWSHGPSR